MKKTVWDRFWEKVDTSGECWLWKASLDLNGYGRFTIGRREEKAHRTAYILIKGSIPDNLVCDHLCRNSQCVNPNHIELVTQRENVLRGISLSAKRAKQIACHNGHAFTEKNTYIPIGTHARKCRECHKLRMRRERFLSANTYGCG